MLCELLEFDKLFLFSKNLHQNKYQALLQDFAENIDPLVGYEVIVARVRGANDEIIPLEELPTDNQKIVVFDDLVCEKNQNDIINYFIIGRHRNCSVIYLTQTFYKLPKNIQDNCSHFCLFIFLPREKKRIANELEVDPSLLQRATGSLSFTTTNRKNWRKRILTKQYNRLSERQWGTSTLCKKARE